MIISEKILKIDLFTCCVASAPVIVDAYNDSLVPLGILMGVMVAIIGTGMRLIENKILFSMVKKLLF